MTPQQIKVVNYINLYGSITPLDAFRDLGITKLATIVSQLKRLCFVFYQSFESSKNRFGEPCHYMRYWLDKKIYEKDMGEKFKELLTGTYDDLFLKEEKKDD